MKNKYLSNIGMQVLDRLTDRYPVTVPKLFERMFISLIGNRFMNGFYRRSYANKLQRIVAARERANKPIEKLLVIVDVNLGDAVMMQSAALALKDRFPAAAVDYVCNKAGGTLVKGTPEIRRVYNIFGQFMVPTPEEMETLRGIIREERYDAVFNFCPFLQEKNLRAGSPVIQMYVPLASEVISGWDARHAEEDVKIHLTYIADSIVRMMAGAAKQERVAALRRVPPPVHGAKVFLPHEAIAEAQSLLNERGLIEKFIVLIHADTPFRFTQIPLRLQVQILERILLANSDKDTAILLSAGKAEDGFGESILSALPDGDRRRVVLVPRLSIAGYAALIDASDVFISADTGPLHIAAARKFPTDGRDTLGNTTAVISVYGSTSSRMSGYDSTEPGHIPGRQNAPAKAFVAAAPCRNITCIDKPAKTCAVARCFDGLQAQEIAGYVNSYIALLREHAEREMKRRRVPKQRA